MADQKLEKLVLSIEARTAQFENAPVVSMVGPWLAQDWRERHLFVPEALELRDRLNELFPLDETEEGASNGRIS